MDPFSEILSGMKLNAAIFFNAEFSTPWGVAVPAAPHLLLYHMVVEGEAMVEVAGQRLALSAGDVVVLPGGHAHHMGSQPPASGGGHRDYALDYTLVQAKIDARDLTPLRAGGGGAGSRLVCGYLAFDPHLSRPILEALPPAFKVHIRHDRSGHWLESSILHLVEEAGGGHAGSEAMLAKLSEALVIDTVRRFAASLPEGAGWLTGARDPIVGKSLGLLHSRVAQPWTIALLAEAVGLSRSALVERFTRYLGEPPMAYLTRWRLQLAARWLTHTTRGIAAIAGDVGYESEAAFNRAFKRAFGQPPGQYRQQRQRPTEEELGP